MKWKMCVLLLALMAAALGGFGVVKAGAASQTNQKYLHLARVLHVRALENALAVPLPPGHTTDELRAEGYGQLSFVSSAANRNFYMIDHTGGGPCFASGRIGRPYPIGVWRCPEGGTVMPSAKIPLVDLSIVGSENGGPMHIVSLAGFAANNVAHVTVIDAAGNPVLRVPVTNNVFASSADLGTDAVRMEAIDANGAVLAVLP